MSLPLAISVPHAGLLVPTELRDQCLLSLDQIVADGDVGSAEIYALRSHVDRFATTQVARAVIDMNRAADDDARADGLTKTHTCWQEPVWREPLSPAARRSLVDRYHAPYHRKLRGFTGKVKLGVDCHTMSDVGPPIGPDSGRPRPLVCLGDVQGTSCPSSWMEALQECLLRYLGSAGDVTINEPFAGGYITRSHCLEMPWVQLEMSRTADLSVADKHEAVLRALQDWCALDLSAPVNVAARELPRVSPTQTPTKEG